ncbi:MAG: GIN domain-containing protein [Sphingobacteriales bacterium]
MKTSAIAIVAIAILALGTVNLSNATAKNNNDSAVVLNNTSKINKIEIRGNVQVFVSDGTCDKVKVYNKYYSENALVQSENGVLRISSYTKDKLVVWVTANDLRSISVYDNAEVKSFGKLSEIDLDVNLYNTATATLMLDSYSASINVNDQAKVNLSGNLDTCDLQYSNQTTVNQSGLKAASINSLKQFLKPVEHNEADELAIL